MTDESPRDRSAELEARLAELERQVRSGAGEARSGIETAFWATMRSIFPDDARKHLRAASREQLLAARSYLDRWIARLDESESPEADRGRERIEIE